MPGKIARSPLSPLLRLPGVTTARTARLSCQNAEKAQEYTRKSGVIEGIPAESFLRGVYVMVDVINVHSAQTLEVLLNPPVESPIPFPFNRLLIFTGIAVVQVPSSGPRDDDNLIRETAVLDLSSTHSGGGGGRRQFNPARARPLGSRWRAGSNSDL
jgi:hypothetical protein